MVLQKADLILAAPINIPVDSEGGDQVEMDGAGREALNGVDFLEQESMLAIYTVDGFRVARRDRFSYFSEVLCE